MMFGPNLQSISLSNRTLVPRSAASGPYHPALKAWNKYGIHEVPNRPFLQEIGPRLFGFNLMTKIIIRTSGSIRE